MLDEELRELLISLGLKKKLVKVLLFLYGDKNSGYTSQEIQEKIEMAQPEVSTALKEMEELDWVTSKRERLGSGYARTRYSLIVSLRKVEEYLIYKNQRIIDDIEWNITKMKELVI